LDDRHRWDNVELDLQEIGCECVDWLRMGSLATGNKHLDFIKVRGFSE
jgi:hypothetical protein